MKKRTLLTNIFIIVLMVSIVFVLLAYFKIFEAGQQLVLTISMSLALLSVLLIDIVFPLIDNIDRFKKETSYKVKTIVKVVLFVVSIVFLFLTVKNSIGIFKTQFLGIALFCVAYLSQFFIDLDRGKKAQIEEDVDEDEEDDTDDEDDNEDEEDDDLAVFDDEDEFDNSYDNEDDIK